MTINCDMGEGYGPWTMGPDEAIMPLIDWANIACGGHAGDPDIMCRTLALAREHGVRPGAHPGYPDRRHFGRIPMDIPVDSLIREIQAQIGSLMALGRVEGIRLHHVKPHGALYNAMMQDFGLLVRLANAVAELDRDLVFVLQATPDRELHRLALQHTGLTLAFEAFADRTYRSDGRLTPRSESGSVLVDPSELERHLRSLIAGTVQTPEGPIQLGFDTLCVHGDAPGALDALRLIHRLKADPPDPIPPAG